jgi:hypothetical protein
MPEERVEAKVDAGQNVVRFGSRQIPWLGVSVRKLMFTPAVKDVVGVTASEAPNRVPITFSGSNVVPATSPEICE